MAGTDDMRVAIDGVIESVSGASYYQRVVGNAIVTAVQHLTIAMESLNEGMVNGNEQLRELNDAQAQGHMVLRNTQSIEALQALSNIDQAKARMEQLLKLFPIQQENIDKLRTIFVHSLQGQYSEESLVHQEIAIQELENYKRVL